MKSLFLKAAAVAVVFSLIAPASALAGPKLNFYSGTGAKAQTPGLTYVSVPHIGLPTTTITHFNNQTGVTTYTYTGSKRIECGFSVLNASLSAVSSTKDLEARARENYIYIENIGLRAGESATVTLTFKHKEYGTIIQDFKVTLTDGSAAFPHLISSKEDLVSIKELGLGKNYVQTADIDLFDVKQWSPIGDTASPFTGVYDGGGYKVKNMVFSTIDTQTPALFGAVKGRNARVVGLHVEGSVNNRLYPANAHGTVAGILDEGTISDCSFTGDMTFGTGKINAGGIVSEVINGGSIKNCKFSGKISSQNNIAYIGGIVGIVNTGSFAEGCEVSGQIISENTNNEANIGGVAGLNKGTISDCFVKADISKYGTNGYLGGIVGYSYSDINESAFDGKLYSKGSYSWVGGITGCSVGKISDCAVAGEITFLDDDMYIGGIVGRNEQGTVENSLNKANISGQGTRCFAGGIAGDNYSFIDHDNVGSNRTVLAAIIRCVSEGDIKLNGTAGFAGGIAGRNFGHTSVEGGTPGNAKSLIEKCAVKSASIEAGSGSKAGRITAERLLASAGSMFSSVHIVEQSDNAAYEKTLINGKEASENTTADGINGESLSAAEIEDFITKNGISPEAERFLK